MWFLPVCHNFVTSALQTTLQLFIIWLFLLDIPLLLSVFWSRYFLIWDILFLFPCHLFIPHPPQWLRKPLQASLYAALWYSLSCCVLISAVLGLLNHAPPFYPFLQIVLMHIHKTLSWSTCLIFSFTRLLLCQWILIDLALRSDCVFSLRLQSMMKRFADWTDSGVCWNESCVFHQRVERGLPY